VPDAEEVIATLTPDSKQRRPLPPFFERLVSFGAIPQDPYDQQQLKRMVVASLWFSLIPNTVFTTMLFTAGTPFAGATLLMMEIFILTVLFSLKLRPATWPGIFHLLVGGNFGVIVVMSALFGGLAESGANFVWGFATVLAAVVVFRDWRALAWLATYIVLLIATEVALLDAAGRYELPNAEIQGAVTLSVVATFVFLVLLYFVRQRDVLQRESDDLLRNVLPDEIAERIKRSSSQIADYFEEASILFADVVDFTPLSAGMTPAETVELLNEVFSTFDDMVAEAGLEKIKTVGDEYMVAAGVPEPRADHAHALADLALAMSRHVADNDVRGHRLVFRMGINSGPVVAGVIGRKKFIYDLWGDAVNTASRMESHGVEGRIQISEATHLLICEDFDCEPRGEIEIKGKGVVSAWYLDSRSPHSSL
jgi:guanylate cyclase